MPSLRRQKAPSYLQQRGRRWYAVMEIPKSLRPRFGGKPRFLQSLGTESRSEAENLVHGVIAMWKAQLTEDEWPSITTVARGRKHRHPLPSPV